jgi:hypothetical protein
MAFHSSGVLMESPNFELSLGICSQYVFIDVRKEGCRLEGRSMLYNEHEHAIARYVIAFGHAA